MLPVPSHGSSVTDRSPFPGVSNNGRGNPQEPSGQGESTTSRRGRACQLPATHWRSVHQLSTYNGISHWLFKTHCGISCLLPKPRCRILCRFPGPLCGISLWLPGLWSCLQVSGSSSQPLLPLPVRRRKNGGS